MMMMMVMLMLLTLLSMIQTDLSQMQDKLEHITSDLQEELAGKVGSIGGLQEQLAMTQSKLLVRQRELWGLGFISDYPENT